VLYLWLVQTEDIILSRIPDGGNIQLGLIGEEGAAAIEVAVETMT